MKTNDAQKFCCELFLVFVLMNVECQFCGLVVCILLWILYSTKRQLNLYGATLFKNLLLFAIVLLSLDIASLIGIRYQEHLPHSLVIGICKTYIVALVFEVGTAFIYLLYDVLGETRHRKYVRIFVLLKCVEALVVYLVPLFIHSEGRIAYTEGPGALFAYGFCGVDFLAIIFVAFVKKNKILPRRWIAFMTWIVIWILSAIFQFLDPELLLVGFAASLGTLILYATLENQDGIIVRELGCFNGYALELYLKQLFERQNKFCVIQFSIDDIEENQKAYIRNLLGRPIMQRNVYLFKLLGSQFLLITEDESLYRHIMDWAFDELENDSSNLKNVQVLGLHDGLVLKSPDNIVPFAHYLFSKYKGRNAILKNEVSSDIVESFLILQSMQDEIQIALSEDRVEVFLQPIYSTKTKSFVSAEALVRIRRPDGSLIPPGLFIPAAESSGSIVALGERIFEKVCLFIASCDMQKLGIEYIEINLSVRQCEQENLADRLSVIMEKYDIDPKFINLEITETATLNAKKVLLGNMEKLLAKGNTFSLDDFGKGESNLMYIVEMPVSIVKMDYDLTKAFFSTPKAKSVVKSVVKMAHDMGLSVVAEGIETKEELDAFVAEGVDYIQGFYFSKPLPMNEFLVYLRREI